MQRHNQSIKLLSKKVAHEALLTQRKIISTNYKISVANENVSPPKKSCLEQSEISLSKENASIKKKRKAPLAPSTITELSSDSNSPNLTPNRKVPVSPDKKDTHLCKHRTMISESLNGPPKPPRIFDSPIKKENENSKLILEEEEGESSLYPWKELHEIKTYKQRLYSPMKLLKKNPLPTLVVTDMVDRRISRDPLGDIIILNDSTKLQLNELQDSINHEISVIKQTMKALHECQNNINKQTSKSIVECQMHLLMASKRRTQLMIQMQKLRSGVKYIQDNFNLNVGKCIVSNIKLPIKNIYDKTTVETHFFILMLRHNNEVQFTILKSYDDQTINQCLEFNDPIELLKVHQDSSIDIEIYSTLISTSEEKNIKSPHKIFSVPKNILTKKKLKNENLKCFGLASNVNKIGQIKTFTLVANSKIKVDNQTKVESYFERSVAFNSPLSDHIIYDVSFKQDVILQMSGFLTQFEMVHDFGAWHRRWFKLSNAKLIYWNYPSDCDDQKAELGSIDLRKCTMFEISTIPRDICARPNTFEILLTKDKVWLSADSFEERTQWCQILNQQLLLFRN